MRKNKTMRFASMLLVLTLLSTSVISGTFAKYTTSDNATDTARVAKWGVTVAATGDAFATDYDAEATNFTVSAATKADNTRDKVVAPGTTGTLGGLSVEGTPEVSGKITYNIDFELGDNWLAKATADAATATYYCPIEIKIGQTTLKGTDNTYTTVTAFEEAVEDAIATAMGATTEDSETDGKYVVEFKPNDNLENKTGDITWTWAFEGNNFADTYLGDANTPAEITFTVSVTAEQVD